jgi:diguanylate cyclase (GGDEF)-like protein
MRGEATNSQTFGSKHRFRFKTRPVGAEEPLMEEESLDVEPPKRASRSSLRIHFLSVTIGLVAALLVSQLSFKRIPNDGVFHDWWGFCVLAALFASSELLVVHLRVGRSAHTVSVVEATVVVALFHSAPMVGLAAHLFGCGLVLGIHRRQGATKLLFNLAMFAVENQTAFFLFQYFTKHLHNRPTSSPRWWPAVYGSVAAFTVLGVVLVFLVIRLAEGSVSKRDLKTTTGISLINSLAMASVGIMASVLIANAPAVSLLMILPIAGAYVATQLSVRERHRIEDLEFLRASSTKLLGQDVAELALWSVLEAARAEFRVELIEYEYRDQLGSPWRRVSFRRNEEAVVKVIERSGLASVVSSTAQLVVPSTQDSVVAKELLKRDLKHIALVVAVSVAQETEGVLIISQPSTDVISFGPSDLRLAEMLASQLSLATEKARLGQSVVELRRLETQLVFELQHDPMTGILNRSAFLRRLREALLANLADQSSSTPSCCAVMFLDLDDFKTINDNFGHAAGDTFLRTIASRIESSIRNEDLACRLGGDEFAVLVNSVANREEATLSAHRILRALRQPIELRDGEFVTPGASIGVAITLAGDTPESAIERADAAMFKAKHRGKGQIEVSDPAMGVAAQELYELELELDGAATRGELELAFQSVHYLGDPSAETDSYRGSKAEVIAYEGLVRWNHPRLGRLTPDQFMPTGLRAEAQRELRRFVSSSAVLALTDLRVSGFAGVLSINIEAGQALDDAVLEDISILQESGLLSQDRLLIEIPESAFLRSSAAMLRRVEQLKDAGAGIVLDDLGLDRLPFGLIEKVRPNQVKLSRGLVSELLVRSSAQPFVKAIAELGKDLAYDVIAKGIEDEATARLVSKLGCPFGQGFYFAHPMTLGEITASEVRAAVNV